MTPSLTNVSKGPQVSIVRGYDPEPALLRQSETSAAGKTGARQTNLPLTDDSTRPTETLRASGSWFWVQSENPGPTTDPGRNTTNGVIGHSPIPRKSSTWTDPSFLACGSPSYDDHPSQIASRTVAPKNPGTHSRGWAPRTVLEWV